MSKLSWSSKNIYAGKLYAMFKIEILHIYFNICIYLICIFKYIYLLYFIFLIYFKIFYYYMYYNKVLLICIYYILLLYIKYIIYYCNKYYKIYIFRKALNWLYQSEKRVVNENWKKIWEIRGSCWRNLAADSGERLEYPRTRGFIGIREIRRGSQNCWNNWRQPSHHHLQKYQNAERVRHHVMRALRLP